MDRLIHQLSTGKRLGNLNKAKLLVSDGATIIKQPTEFVESLVCVIHNGTMEDAVYCYTEKILQELLYGDRFKEWLIYPHADEMSLEPQVVDMGMG